MRRFLLVMVLLSGLVVAGGVGAAVTITISESGGNVVATYSGTLNTTGLTLAGSSSAFASVEGSLGFLGFGTGTTDAYTGLTGPSSFGTGSSIPASSSTGDQFTLFAAAGRVDVPLGYTPGNPISGTSTFNGTSIATLGLTPGTYSYSWSSDTITLTIGPAPSAVPTLSEWAQFLLALMVIGVAWHFHNKDQNSY